LSTKRNRSELNTNKWDQGCDDVQAIQDDLLHYDRFFIWNIDMLETWPKAFPIA